MPISEEELKRLIEDSLRRLGPKLAARFELGWVGPLAAAAAIYPYLGDYVKDILEQVPDLAPLWLFRPRSGEDRRPLMAVPIWDRPGGTLACRLVTPSPAGHEDVKELSECAQLLWHAVRRGWLPSPREEDAFRQALERWTGPEIFIPVRGIRASTHLLYAAIKAGDEVALAEMIEAEPALVSRPHPSGTTPILYALYCGQAAIARKLEERGAPLEAAELTALGRRDELEAKIKKEPGIVRKLSPDGFPLLHLAAHFGQEDIVDLLLTNGADPDAVAENVIRNRPLHSAVAFKDPLVAHRLVQKLLDAGANPNVQQKGGWTPLHGAAIHGRLQTLNLLLARGADPTLTADDGSTALALAARAGHEAIVRRLSG
jgi:hypothetical protein